MSTKQQSAIPFFESTLVAGLAGHGCSYPCSLAVLPDGRLITTYSVTWHEKEGGHRCRAAASFSADGGRTWGEPTDLFYNGMPFAGASIPTHNFADPNIAVFDDRVVVYCHSALHLPGQGSDLAKAHEWYRESTDSGKTWGPAAEIAHNHNYFAGINHKTLRLADGSYVRGFGWERKSDAGVHTGGEGEQDYVACLLRTTDNGKTWREGGGVEATVRAQNALSYAIHGTDEPAYVQLDDGSLYTLVRTGGSHLYQARSHDMGQTWSAAEPSPLVSHNCPAELLSIGEGRVLVIYNHHERLRTNMCARLSIDGCKSWGPPKIFAPVGYMGEEEAAYPVAALLADGTVGVVWGEYRKVSARDRYKINFARFNIEWLLA